MRLRLSRGDMMHSYLRSMHFQTKLGYLIFFAVFLPLVLSVFLFNSYIARENQKALNETVTDAFTQTYGMLSSRFELVRENILLMLLDGNSRELLQGKRSDTTLMQKKALKDKADAMVDFIESREGIWRLYIYVPDDYSEIIDRKHYFPFSDTEGSPWFHELIEGPYRDMWSYGYHLGEQERHNISYFVRVCDAVNYQKTVAVLRIDIALNDIEEILGGAASLNDSRICLLDKNDVVATSGGDTDVTNLFTDLTDFSFFETKVKSVTQGSLKIDVRYRTFKNQPWLLVMTVPNPTGVMSLNLGQWQYILLLVIAGGILSFMASVAYTQRISRGLKLVSKSMKDLQNGFPDPLPPPKSNDEIGELIKSYNYLTRKLKELMDVSLLASKSLKNAELRALRAQINPHFLYNTLELINYHSYKKDTAAVSEVVTLLSRFYKLSLNRQKEFCEIWQELELTECYFKIQNMRYHGKIMLNIDVPISLYQKKIPHIILQPLVENAIYHGIMKREDEVGEVTISAVIEGDVIMMSVTDTGVGMDEEILKNLDGGENLEIRVQEHSTHYGVTNINERLKGYYGESFKLVYESKPGFGTKVSFAIPL